MVSMSNNTEMLNSSEVPQLSNVRPYMDEYFTTTKVLAHTWPAILLFGMVANTFNILVFLKAGARDNVTVLLLCLAISDLTFLVLITPTMCGFVIQAFARSYSWPFDFRILFYLLYWPAYTAFDLSIYISITLGVIRCACVTLPLKFKSIFTKSRTLKWLLFLVALAVSLRIPVLSAFRIAYKKNPITNITSPYLIAVNFEQMTRVNDVLNRGVMMYFSFFTMVSCVVLLSYKLLQASKIRQRSTGKNSDDVQTKIGKSSVHKISSKDVHVIQSVTLVCFIFVLAQLPFVSASMARLINPELGDGQRLSALFGLISQVSVTCSYLNASVNIFVYYKFNSKYRATMLSLLGKNDKKETS